MTEKFNFIKSASQTFGAGPALIEANQEISFAQLEDRVNLCAEKLTEAKIKQNDRVGLWAANSAEQISLFLALLQIKAVVCLMSVRQPSLVIRNLAEQTGLSTVVSDRQIELAAGCNNVILNDLARQSENDKAKPTECQPMDFDQIATIVFTSGSISAPKVVGHTLGNHYYNALGANENIPFEPSDRWLLSLPLYHVGGLGILFRSLIGGGAVAISDPKLSLASQIKKHSITHLSVVNTQLRELLKSDNPDELSKTLKAVIVGGGAQENLLLTSARAIGLPIATTYGLTEMASQVTCSKPTSESNVTNGSGRLLNHRKLKISDKGEILVKGNCLMKGYLSHDNLDHSFDAEGWFHTSDRGEINEAGDLIVLGRLDNMFISGGENIYPEQIEAALLEIQSVEQVLVLPVADEKFGHRPVAFVKFSLKPSLALDELADLLSKSLPPFMIPIRFFAWPRSLESSGLKPSLSRLKQLAEELIQAGA